FGSSSVTLFGINDNDVITGDYIDNSGAQHGFIGPFDGSNYKSFDDPDGTTQPRAINDKGWTTGFDTGSLAQWERNPKGTLKPITQGGNPVDFALAQGLNKAGDFVGDYSNSKGVETGASGLKYKYTADISLSIKNTGYAGRAIDDSLNIGGWYFDSSSI